MIEIMVRENTLSWWTGVGSRGVSEVECALCWRKAFSTGVPGVWSRTIRGRPPTALWSDALYHLLDAHGVKLEQSWAPVEPYNTVVA